MNHCHHDDDHVSTAPAIAAFLVLIVFGLAVRYWVWVAAGVGVLVLGAVLLRLSFYLARRVDARYERERALVARADQQHAWTLAGDDRGIYGDYIPKKIDLRAGSIPVSRTDITAAQSMFLILEAPIAVNTQAMRPPAAEHATGEMPH